MELNKRASPFEERLVCFQLVHRYPKPEGFQWAIVCLTWRENGTDVPFMVATLRCKGGYHAPIHCAN